MSLGWDKDKAVGAIYPYYPDIVTPEDFPSLWATSKIDNIGQASGFSLKAVPQRSRSSSNHGGSGSKGRAPISTSHGSKGPLYEKILQPMAGKRLQEEESSSKSSEDSDEDDEEVNNGNDKDSLEE